MGKGPLLKAQYNRVRTSTALQGNNMWNNTIGLESNAGGNSAIEASIYAPTIGGGHKAARQERAQGLIDASGFTPTVTTYQGLLDLARQQGATGNATRGACKICGGLGHLTKQCKNGVSGHLASGADLDAPQALAGLGMLADPNVSDLDSDDLDSSSESGDDSDGKRKRREREKEKEKDKERDRKSKKRKEHKRKKDKKEKKRKSHKESRRGGDDDSGSSDEEARRSKHRKRSSSKKSARDKDKSKDSSGSDSD